MSNAYPEVPSFSTSDVFRPTRARIALAALVAIIAFWLPQEVALEYYPLNNPSSGLQYLEIKCAADVRSRTQVFLDIGRGFNEQDTIGWPIGPSEETFTYIFPLPDAPLFRLRLDPITSGTGEFTITRFRIINRREEEILRFSREQFTKLRQVSAVVPTADGWKLVMKDSHDPQVLLPLKRPLIAEGMNERNLKRCILSTSYLALMLWIILLAVYFAFRVRGEGLRSTVRTMAFLLFLACCFAFVGNRGLIRNSIRYARIAVSHRAG